MVQVLSITPGKGCAMTQAYHGPKRKHVHWVTHYAENGADIIILNPAKHGFALPRKATAAKGQRRAAK